MVKVLVVEDDSPTLGLLTEALVKRGAWVFGASGAAQAFEVIRVHEFDVAVIDVLMPDISGFELCRFLRGQIRNLFLMSSAFEEKFNAVAKEYGALELLDKCQPEKVVETVLGKQKYSVM